MKTLLEEEEEKKTRKKINKNKKKNKCFKLYFDLSNFQSLNAIHTTSYFDAYLWIAKHIRFCRQFCLGSRQFLVIVRENEEDDIGRKVECSTLLN